MSTLLLMDNFVRYIILNWSFSLSTLNILLYSLLTLIISEENLAIILILDPP